MKLYSYWRSSAAYRIRIALNLKGIAYQQQAINLLKSEHKDPAYLTVNPAGLVPALELDNGRVLTQSTAVLEWLDSEYPQAPLLPTDSLDRADVMSWAYTIACEIHPINNIGVTNYLKKELNADGEQVTAWMHNWFERGFSTLEASIKATPYCFGEKVTMADLLLVPMAYNALRFNYDLGGKHPKVMAVYEACNKLPAFIDARPENQPDAVG